MVALPDWEQRLPRDGRRTYGLEPFGNRVVLTLKLSQWVRQPSGQPKVSLLLEVRLSGTGHER